MIGLEIDLKKIISAGTSILVTAASQILGGTVAGVAFFYLIGFPVGRSESGMPFILGIAAALSSTVIIVKMLYDKRELDTLPGRVTLGVLVLQDLFVILFLAVQPSLDDLRTRRSLLVARPGDRSSRECAQPSAAFCCRRSSAAWRGCRNWCWSARWPGASWWAISLRESSSRGKWAR